MLKFFRRIRYNKLSNNKISKYLLYAAGEIILVVIGILIALQINNWNEHQKLKIKQEDALVEILSDLNTNKTGLRSLLYDENWNISHSIRSILSVIDHIEADKKYHDSLSRYFAIIHRYEEVVLKTSGYESLSSIGMELILDPEFRSKIGEYYTTIIRRPTIAYNELRDDFYHYMLDYGRKDFIQKEFNTGRMNSLRLVPRNFEKLKEKGDYLESLKVYYDVNVYYKLELEHALRESDKLFDRIEEYLEEN